MELFKKGWRSFLEKISWKKEVQTEVNIKQPIKWMICEDQPLFRAGIINWFKRYPDLQFIGEASNGQELLDKLQVLNPDIIILNVQMPVLDGIKTLPLLLKQNPLYKVIVLSFLNNPAIIKEMLDLGAKAYITKDSGGEEIYNAIVEVHEFGFYINQNQL